MVVTMFAVVLLAALAAYTLVAVRPGTARDLLTVRRLVSGTLAVVFAFILIGTGRTAPMLAGAFILFFAVLWILIEDPSEEVV